LNELALFAGAGGGILGGHLLGWRTVAAVEIEDYPRRVLLQRQADGLLPRFPIWDDICTFDGKPWAGKVDVISGGFPCQDISAAGNGDGLEGQRSGMWSEMARIIYEVQPRFVFVENSPMLTSRGLGRVLGDLASMGFDARWGVLGADFAGFDHKRNRIWIVANSFSNRLEGRDNRCSPGQWKTKIRSMAGLCKAKTRIDLPSPDSFGIANGVASRMDRLKAIGNGQVSSLAAAAWRILK
jgi:DNA (cytosine-5)-methyltransferase 1